MKEKTHAHNPVTAQTLCGISGAVTTNADEPITCPKCVRVMQSLAGKPMRPQNDDDNN